ncbi:hypothetical protein HDU81_000657 [Chytriomyces hyalinus]|nr:hypothetical protein HDU81_000657 [Chytriomyces hyalinus]
MYWDGPEAPVFGTAHRRNQYNDANIDRVELPCKVDGIVRLLNYDSEGYEALVLEVSGPASDKNLSKHVDDFFKLGQEMQDCWDHTIFKVQSARKSSQMHEKLCVFGIQCWGFDMEMSVYFQLFKRKWIVPLFKLKIPSVLKDAHNHLKNIEIAMVSIKTYLLTIVKLLEDLEFEPEAYSPRQNNAQIQPTPIKQMKIKNKKKKKSPGSL